MGKKKPTAKAPVLQKPVSINAPFGSATYKNGTYTMNAQGDASNLANLQSAQAGFGNALSRIQNPQSAIDQQMQVYRNQMQPAFDQTLSEQLGKSISGLGNRYAGTFGQLTLADQARQQALAQATLNKNIYDSGQDAFQRLLSQAGQYQGLASGAQTVRLQPYELMGNILNQAGSNVTGYNNANVGSYAAQQQAAGQQQSGLSTALNTVGTLVGTAAKFIP